MELATITEGLPAELTNQLLPSEAVYYFTYLSRSGCLSNSWSKSDFWLALTQKRLIYKTNVVVNNIKSIREGVLPFDKISFIEVKDTKHGCSGCSMAPTKFLMVSASGGTVEIPVASAEKGNEIKNLYQQLADN
ncbi:MAG TPA: hypothetical protein HA263_09620 [Methanoregulaceae archaeon]|nr:hypothetical protein [Methanoregulaceae archaeon]